MKHADQLDLFDGSGAERARTGIEQVLDHEGKNWQEATVQRIVPFLRSHPEYCADDLYRHNLMPWHPHHPNAIRALTRRLRESGYLSDPVRYIKSQRAEAQSRRIPVYTSLVYRKGE